MGSADIRGVWVVGGFILKFLIFFRFSCFFCRRERFCFEGYEGRIGYFVGFYTYFELN